jgi:hypothetical protein
VERQGSEEHPFNPRTEVFAGAKFIASRIVKHRWIIFVLLPFRLAAVCHPLLLVIGGVIYIDRRRPPYYAHFTDSWRRDNANWTFCMAVSADQTED